ncbi:ATP-binding protein, partial [Staphylococcus epidermidis]
MQFIYDLDHNQFYFIQMNTPIQLQHPLTQILTPLHLLKLQLKLPIPHPLPFKQQHISINPHPIDFRLTPQTPYTNFIPSPPNITQYLPPRPFALTIQSPSYTNYTIPPYYDSILPKLILHQPTPQQSIMTAIPPLTQYLVLP